MKVRVGFAALVTVLASTLAMAQQGAATPGSTQPAQAPAAAATIKADPAIWRIKGKSGTVYLFGSVHVMKPNVDWQSAKVKAAMDSSDVVYLEIANMDDASVAQPLALKYGVDPSHPLSTKISKEDVAALDAAAKNMGFPGEAMFEPMQPWMVSTALQVVPMMKSGYDPSSGIDMKVLSQSKGKQKTVKGFETMEEQVHMLADAPQEQQVEMLHKELAELDKSAAEMNGLVEAWEHGDVDSIAKMENDELATKYPAEYKRLVVDRNTKWATTLDGLLKDPATGNVFVIVGAAHLAGPDSVVKMLEKDGWKVERE